jgi:GNAT superfamily N-acetyltransferase
MDDALLASVREATADDLDPINDLWTRSRAVYNRGFVAEEQLADPARAIGRRAFLARALLCEDYTVICAGHGDYLAGFAVIGPCEPSPDPDPRLTNELHSLYVDPGSFRQRVGTSLHSACIQVWRSLPATAARLWVLEYNHRARAFYASKGWEPDGHRRPDNPAVLGYRLSISRQTH